jgi:hypothetical protein
MIYALITKLADGLGFEPRQADPESAVLPLHYPSVRLKILYYKSLFFNDFQFFLAGTAFLTLAHVSFRVTVRL